MPKLVAVDGDPFATSSGPKLVPVDGDPFASAQGGAKPSLAAVPSGGNGGPVTPIAGPPPMVGQRELSPNELQPGFPGVPEGKPSTYGKIMEWAGSTWPARLAQGAVEGAKDLAVLPHDVYTGKADLNKPEDLDRAIGASMNLLQPESMAAKYGAKPALGAAKPPAPEPVRPPAIENRIKPTIEPTVSRETRVEPKLTPVEGDPFKGEAKPAEEPFDLEKEFNKLMGKEPQLKAVDEDPFAKLSEAVKPQAPPVQPPTAPVQKPKIVASTPKSFVDYAKEITDDHNVEPTHLPMDYEARMKRAQSLGFDTNKTFYHGTGSNFVEFNPKKGKSGEKAIFVTEDPKVASAYGGGGESPQTIPLFARIENPLEIDAGGHGYSNPYMLQWLNQAKEGGHDVLIVKNLHDIGGGGKPQTQYAFLKPENLRAKYGAAFDPAKKKSANMLSAAADTAEKEIPERPSKPFVQDQDDRLFRLRQSATADKAELTQRVEAMPDEVKSPAVQEKLYLHMENPEGVKLTPQEQAIYDEHIAPLKQEERDLYDEIRSKGLDTEEFGDPDYVHRMVKGKTPQLDRLAGEGGDAANPVGGRSLPMSTSSLKSRKFFVIEDEKGLRKVVALDDKGGIRLVTKGKDGAALQNVGIDPRSPVDDVKPGAKINVGGKSWDIKQARTPEIEDASGIEYYKNAVANTVDNVARLRTTSRAIAEVERMKSTPEWKAYTTRYNDPKAPKDWRVPAMPLFRDFKMDPKLANVIDDFYGKGGPISEVLSKINRFATSSLFWSPVPHALNAGAHWATARGWDWITPPGIKSLAVDSSRALREVITQGPKYQQMLRDGSGLVYGGIANREFYETILKGLGENIKANPQRWNPVIRTLGLSKPADLVKMLYGASSRALWSVSDMFMMQRVLELERKGMSPRQALKEAEKHIPNYRIPSEVLGSRAAQQMLTNPMITQFSRYHYGMFKSYAHMAKDLAVGTGKERLEATGNVMVTAAMMAFAWPLVNNAIQNLTGNKDAKASAHGSTTIPQDLLDLYHGDKDIFQVVNNMITLSPALKYGLETLTNTDFFSGRKIAEPGDLRAAAGGSPKAAGKVLGQEAEHTASSLVQPYAMASQADRSKKGIVKGLRDQALGIQEPTSEQLAKKRKAFHMQDAQARSRGNKPHGLLEQLFGR